jgi:hypothetical protein
MYTSINTKAKASKDIYPDKAWELISNNRDSNDLVIIDVVNFLVL